MRTRWGLTLLPGSACLTGFTRHAAYAAGVDRRTGSPTVGRDADIVVLETDPFTVPAHELASVRVCSTYFRGTRVW